MSDLVTAVIALALNAFVLPGSGTLLSPGKTEEGLIQMALWLSGLIITVITFGCGALFALPMSLCAWGWSVIGSAVALRDLR